MIWYLVDNVNVIYFLLAVILLGLGVLFWQTKRVREIVAMIIIIAIGGLVWYLTSFVMTDRKQVEHNMNLLAQAALDRRPEQITKLLSRDFEFEGMKKAQIGEYVTTRAASVTNYYISSFVVEKLTHDKDQGRADVSFRLRIDHANGMTPFLCQSVFVIEDGQWLLRSIELKNPVVDSNTTLAK